jgi:hypothetical protein
MFSAPFSHAAAATAPRPQALTTPAAQQVGGRARPRFDKSTSHLNGSRPAWAISSPEVRKDSTLTMSTSSAHSAAARWPRALVAAAVAAVALLTAVLAAQPAAAGTFTVQACSDAVPGNASWTPSTTGQPSVTAYQSATDCRGQGLVTRSSVSPTGSTAPYAAEANYEIVAPGGAALTAISGQQQGASNNNWTANIWADNVSVQAPFGSGASPWNPTLDALWNGSPFAASGFSASKLRMSTRCNTGAGCRTNASGDQTPSGAYAIRRIAVNVTDGTAPGLDGNGIWDDGNVNAGNWVDISGGTPFSMGASDNVGVKKAWVSWNPHNAGAWTESADGDVSCDYSRTAPCNGDAASATLSLPDGIHSISVGATDSADNTNSATKEIKVDNSVPGGTGVPAITGGEAPFNVWRNGQTSWTSTTVRDARPNSFPLGFSVPASSGSDNTGGAVELCRYDSESSNTALECHTDNRTITDGEETVAVPNANDGVWRARFRVNDAIHTGDWGAQSGTLLIDRSRPTAASNLRFGAGDSSEWTNDAKYDLTWNKPNPGAAPESIVDTRICRTDGTDCEDNDNAGVNNNTPQATVTTPDDGEWQTQVRVVDDAGNIGQWSPAGPVQRYDKTPPDAPDAVDLAPTESSAWTNDRNYKVEWEKPAQGLAPEPTGEYEVCNVDTDECETGPVSNTAETATVPVPEDGVWKTRVRVKDTAGNIGAWSAWTAPMQYDSTPPAQPEQTKLGEEFSSAWTNKGDFELNWNAPTEGLSPELIGDVKLCEQGDDDMVADGGTCRIFTETANNTTELAKLTLPHKTGVYDARVRVRDTAGNVGAWSSRTPVMKYDLNTPDQARGDRVNGWVSKVEALDYKIQANERDLDAEVLPSGIAGYAVTIDSGSPGNQVTHAADANDPARSARIPEVRDLNEGKHRLQARAISRAGNAASDVELQELNVDVTAPTVEIAGVPTRPVNRAVELKILASDALSGMTAASDVDAYDKGGYVEYSIDGGQPERVKGAVAKFTLAEDGAHTIRYSAVDVAGNRSEGGSGPGGTEEISVEIDTQPPGGGMLPTDPANPRRLAFYVTASCLTDYVIQVKAIGAAEWRNLDTEWDEQNHRLYAMIPQDLWDSRASFDVRAKVTDCNGNTTILDRWWEGSKAGELINPDGKGFNPAARGRTTLQMRLQSDGPVIGACTATTAKAPAAKKKNTKKKAKKTAKAKKASVQASAAAAKKKKAKKTTKKKTAKKPTTTVCNGKVVSGTVKTTKKKTTKKKAKAKAKKASVEASAAAAKKKKAKKKTAKAAPTKEAAAIVTEEPKKVYGQLAAEGGKPVAGATVLLEARIKGATDWKTVAEAKTDANGQAVVQVPAGPSRTLRLRYVKTEALDESVSSEVEVKVAASSSIRALKGSAKRGQTVKFTGTIAGGYAAASGLELQGYNPVKKAWIPAQTNIKADSQGRWTSSYKFTATTGTVTYKFRLRMSSGIAGFPFEEGFSSEVTVTVSAGKVAKVSRAKKKASGKKAGR